MRYKVPAISLLYLLCTLPAFCSKLFIPMDAAGQANHLRAYGIAYAALRDSIPINWLLNFKGGSFVIDYDQNIEALCIARGVTCTEIDDAQYNTIVANIKAAAPRQGIVTLQKAPHIAVYTPPGQKPWDDAVVLALNYAQIPFDKIYAGEVLSGALDNYDWLHLHHEDFTGTLSKGASFDKDSAWYRSQKLAINALTKKLGYKKLSQMQLAVVKKIRDFVDKGGNMFAMCIATNTFDVALAAQNTDICDALFDGDPADPNAQARLDYTDCFAFTGFKIYTDPDYKHPDDIDNDFSTLAHIETDYFMLQSYPASPDPVLAMLTQNHVDSIKGFCGQVSTFRRKRLKPDVFVLAHYNKPPALTTDMNGRSHYNIDNLHENEAKYLHGEYGSGTWTFFAGHDPELHQSDVGKSSDLSRHPHSAGYRLILNNVLVPSANRKNVQRVVCCDVPATNMAAPALAKKTLAISGAYTIGLYPMANKQLNIALIPQDPATKAGNIERVLINTPEGKTLIDNAYSAPAATLDISSLPTGMYQVVVNGEYAGKLMKE